MPRERRQSGWVKKTGTTVKTWTGYWYVYVVEDGIEIRRRREKVLGNATELTKGAAEDLIYNLIRGQKPPASGASFEQLSKWYLKTNDGLWSHKWKGTVAAIFKHQILPELGPRIASEIKRSEIQQAINAIAQRSNSQSESILKKCITHIRAVFNMAIDDDLIERNPALKIVLPPTRQASERFLTLAECKRLLAAATIREHLILRLFMVLGLRPSELFALRTDDIEHGSLRIDQTVVEYKIRNKTKTKASKAGVPLPVDLETELLIYIRSEGITDLLFPSTAGTPISPDNYLDRVLKPLGELAGIADLNHQVLRRTTATHFQKHGKVKDAQALLRHSNATTTLKHYQKVLEESLVNSVGNWDAELAKPIDIDPARKRTSTAIEGRKAG
jgi:site-specific recombinase XerD